MSGAERERLRRLIDARRRELIAQATRSEPGCVGCGVPYDQRTVGCTPCSYRHHNYLKRARIRAGVWRGKHGMSGYRAGCKCDVCTAAERRTRGRMAA